MTVVTVNQPPPRATPVLDPKDRSIFNQPWSGWFRNIHNVLQSSSSGGPSAFGPIVAIDRITSTNSGAGQTGGDVFFVGAGAGQYTQLSDLIIIGHNALSAGTAGTPVTDANLAGTIVIGSGAASVLTSATGQGGIGQNGPNTVIGFNALHTAINCNSSTVIGSNAFAQYNN